MTAYEGYVWFLPAWLSKNLDTSGNRTRCTSSELIKVRVAVENLRKYEKDFIKTSQ